ncbi:MAG: branched-chain amino acid ABC transporter permease [Candidimonas sp.]|nr:MAG: branched-chain amino acid ABC transporter permease [Candidimonas sp.]TAM20559.1 MAG: branched-chain amino acid ABC transporter permease [Candidimonas sp.]TAM80031.1 MAG: branched-chain amino acid ABC transporter permease [Candidimonas sp.]
MTPPSPLRRKASASTVLAIALLILLALVPLYAGMRNDAFIITLTTRILIFAVAAVSLNLILGYGGLISFGHALFLGLGVYTASIMSFHGVNNGWLQILATLLICSAVGVLTGSIALRTTGIAFIMITLAFAQMFFFLIVSLSRYGGDDGLTLASGTRFGTQLLTQPSLLYFAAFALLCLSLYASHRLVHSRFGMVVCAAKLNERRMKALGYPTFRYRLALYVISAALCGLAGLLYANLTQFASPSYMSWMTSGDLIAMVVVGGMGTIVGPFFGALGMILAEEWLKSLTEHWMIIFGPLLVVIVTTSRQGLVGLLQQLQGRLSRARDANGRTR